MNGNLTNRRVALLGFSEERAPLFQRTLEELGAIVVPFDKETPPDFAFYSAGTDAEAHSTEKSLKASLRRRKQANDTQFVHEYKLVEVAGGDDTVVGHAMIKAETAIKPWADRFPQHAPR